MVIEALLSSDSKENEMKESGIFPECQKLVLETNVVWTSGQ